MAFETIPSKILYKFTDDLSGESVVCDEPELPDGWIKIMVDVKGGILNFIISDSNLLSLSLKKAIDTRMVQIEEDRRKRDAEKYKSPTA